MNQRQKVKRWTDTRAAMKLSESSFRAVWDNDEDAIYDELDAASTKDGTKIMSRTLTKNITLELPASEAAQLQMTLKESLATMRKANTQMARDHTEIERLKARTQARLDAMRKAA